MTSMCLGFTVSVFGRWTCNIPSLNSAETFSPSEFSGMVKLRAKLPWGVLSLRAKLRVLPAADRTAVQFRQRCLFAPPSVKRQIVAAMRTRGIEPVVRGQTAPRMQHGFAHLDHRAVGQQKDFGGAEERIAGVYARPAGQARDVVRGGLFRPRLNVLDQNVCVCLGHGAGFVPALQERIPL